MEELLWIILILGIVAVGLWIWGLADILKGTFRGNGSKMLWLVVVIFFPIIGVILYLLFGRRRSD